ncbi:MAG: hypothetical protein M1814_006502 [Vezdaea aestivalis]|nr:MAG: hypothetical protein M1814_006502 [Vezdaea aestivalis]
MRLSTLISALFQVLALSQHATASPVQLSYLLPRQDIQTPINASLPNVTIFATGGTIASQGTTNTQTIGYSVGLGVQQLITAVPDLLNVSNIKGYQISNVDSGSINQTILLNLTRHINEEIAKDSVQGIVVTHGTDTLEETAFFLDLTVNATKPVVIVGAMRPATALSADGPLNILQAVILATSKNALNRGVMVSLNDRISSAFYATKNHANALDTFYAAEQGQLGFYINQVPFFYYGAATAVGKTNFNVAGATGLPQVDILYEHQEASPALVNASIASGARGIVFAGVGAGGIPPLVSLAAYQNYNATGFPFVASRRPADGFAPSDDESSWRIGSGFLNPQKARILLQLSILAGHDTAKIRDVFAATYPSPAA